MSFDLRKINLEKITGISLFLVGLLLPISTTFSNIALGLLLATTVWSFITLGVNGSILRNRRFYLYSPLLFFILVFYGTFYSPMDYETLKEVKRNLFMLALPTLLMRRDILFSKALRQAAWGLVVGSLLSAAILLAINTVNLFSEPFSWYRAFSYHHTSFRFTAPLGIHPIYLGSYYFMGLAFILFNTVSFKPILNGISIAVLVLGMVFLNSRIIFGLTALLLIFYILKSFSWKTTLALFSVFLIGLIFLYPTLKQTYLVDKLITGTQWELSDNVGTFSTDKKHRADSRFSRWKIASQLIAERPLIGSGTGTERSVLGVKFKENNMTVSYESRYNAHNQFIGWTIRFGIIGLALVLIYFIGNIHLAIQQKEWIFLWFMIGIIGVSLIENYFDRNMGINFIAFYGTLFFGYCNKKK